jgi:hypothetical protein
MGTESRALAARVLNAIAGASFAAALAAFVVMLVNWLASGQDNASREWPSAGWLICVPALVAALVLVTSAESLRGSGPKPGGPPAGAAGGSATPGGHEPT